MSQAAVIRIFSAEIVKFLEILFQTNVFIWQFSTSNSPNK